VILDITETADRLRR